MNRGPCTDRRQLLQLAACGFGAAAFSALAHARSAREEPQARGDGRHHAPKARSCIFLYMDGGPGCCCMNKVWYSIELLVCEHFCCYPVAQRQYLFVNILHERI